MTDLQGSHMCNPVPRPTKTGARGMAPLTREDARAILEVSVGATKRELTSARNRMHKRPPRLLGCRPVADCAVQCGTVRVVADHGKPIRRGRAGDEDVRAAVCAMQNGCGREQAESVQLIHLSDPQGVFVKDNVVVQPLPRSAGAPSRHLFPPGYKTRGRG